jgi:FkbM family methyltransferase
MARRVVTSRVKSFIRKWTWELARVADVASITPPGSVRKLVRAWVVLTVRHRRRVGPGSGFVLDWDGPSGVLHGTVCDPSEIRVIREVFVNNEYDLPADAAPTTILDLGSNIGMSVLYFQSRYPDATIIAVEPSRTAFVRLERNTRDLSHVHLLRAAAVGMSRPVELVVTEESWTSSLHGDREHHTVEQVSGLTIEQILQDAGRERADVIKMDIEGSEVEILENSSALHRAEWLIFEFHQEHAECNVWDLIARLPNFEIVRIAGDTTSHPLVTLHRRSDQSPGTHRSVGSAAAVRTGPDAGVRVS